MFFLKKYLRIVSAALCLVLMLSLGVPAFAAEMVHPLVLTIETDDGSRRDVNGFYASYSGNIYISMYDMSAALNNSRKHFSFELKYTDRDGEYFDLNTGRSFAGRYGSGTGTIWLEVSRNRLFVDGGERKYYTYRYGNDLYINLGDIELLLDVRAEYLEDGTIHFYTDSNLTIDLQQLADTGYFDFYTGIVVGDATTGVPLFYQNRLAKTSIASTTKLMTYLLVMEAVDRGELSLNENISISQYAAEISNSEDGTISMKRGQEVPVMELLQALLIASSNEAAIALAERIDGTEKAFAERMNRRAQELELMSSEFFNPNGLPVFTDDPFSAKLQNRMSAWDMFRLASYILNHYPQVTDITSMDYCTMESLNYTSANSNPLNFNMPEITGLKTGVTNRAGFCVVSSMPVTVNGVTHNIVSVVLGAETQADRGQAAEVLMRAAKAYYLANGFAQ